MEGVLLPVVVIMVAFMFLAEFKKIGILYIPAILLMLWVALFLGETLIYFSAAGMIAVVAVRIRALLN